MLTELTSEMKAAIPAWNKKWIKIGHSTEPIDMEKAIDAIKLEYEVANIKPPPRERFVYCSNPLVLVLANSIGTLVYNADRRNLKEKPEKERLFHNKGVDQELRKVVSQATSIDVTAPGDMERYLECHHDYTSEISSTWDQTIGGNLWCWYPAWRMFFLEVCGVEELRECKALHARVQTSLNCGWWSPHTHFALVCDRPRELHFDPEAANYQLHNDSGPAVVYGDHYKLWYLHGFAVDEQLVMRPETQTLEQIQSETNNDIRAIRMQRYGLDRYLVEIGAEVLDETRNDIENTHESLLKDDQGNHWLWPTDPSGRICPPLGVPDNIHTCEEARNWLSPVKFNVIGRT